VRRPDAALNIDRALRAVPYALLELTARALVMPVRFEGPRRAAAFDTALEELVPNLTAGDVVVDGSHSYYRDDIDRCSASRSTVLTTSTAPRAAACGGSRTLDLPHQRQLPCDAA